MSREPCPDPSGAGRVSFSVSEELVGLRHRGNIITALRTGSAAEAGAAMRAHLIQTRDDARERDLLS